MFNVVSSTSHLDNGIKQSLFYKLFISWLLKKGLSTFCPASGLCTGFSSTSTSSIWSSSVAKIVIITGLDKQKKSA